MYNCDNYHAMNKPPHISVLRITPRKRFFTALSFGGWPLPILSVVPSIYSFHLPISLLSYFYLYKGSANESLSVLRGSNISK